MVWDGSAQGVKEDGGGSIRGQSRLSDMKIWHAVAACDKQAIVNLVDVVNEVHASGNTALHLAAYIGDESIVALLLELGAKVNASNNAGDRPLHWAMAMEARWSILTLKPHT